MSQWEALTDEQRGEAYRLWVYERKTLAEIAERFHVAEKTVSRAFKRHGLLFKNSSRSTSKHR